MGTTKLKTPEEIWGDYTVKDYDMDKNNFIQAINSDRKQIRKMIDFNALIKLTQHYIPYYAFGDNGMATEMNNRLIKLREKLTELLNNLKEE